MGKIVFVGALSHAPAATGWPEKAKDEEKNNFYEAARKIGESITNAKPDVIIGIANDHVQNFHLSNFPDFAIGIGEEHSGPGEWFEPWLKVPKYKLKGEKQIASQIYNGLIKKGINLASRSTFQFDDNFSVPLTLTGLTTAGIPFIPIMMNCTVPPVISSQESYRVGQLIKDVIENELPDDVKIAMLATGGLSHEPGGPKYFVIDEEFDRWVMDHLVHSSHETIINEVTYEKMEAAGSGGTSELLSWFVVMGTTGADSKCEKLCYEAPKDWRCGMGAVQWHLQESKKNQLV